MEFMKLLRKFRKEMQTESFVQSLYKICIFPPIHFFMAWVCGRCESIHEVHRDS